MYKFLISIFAIIFAASQANAYQDCIVINNGKITDINIEDHSVIDVFPLITVMNEKNTLIVHPLKSGKTRFCALKNSKSLVLFEVQVSDCETVINAPDGFEVYAIDAPNNEFEFTLDEPPVAKE